MIASLIRTRRALFAAGLSLLLAGPAAAVTDPNAAPDCLDNDPGAGIFFICFDDLVSLTTTGAQDFGPVSIDDATVFSEADAALALGFDTSTWATTGDQGILNNLVPVIDFSFDQTVFLFRVDVVVLPGQSGDPGLVVVQGYRDGDGRVWPVKHFSEAEPPLLICVAWKRAGGELKENLSTLRKDGQPLREGVDFWYFV